MAGSIRVLYVDDESDLLEIGKLFLEESGDFSVTTSASAPAGLELLTSEKFDAVISDYQMPGMDGIQFLVEVRTRFGKIPFILFTGRGREEVVIQAINSDVDFYVHKGGESESQFAELSHKIKQAVSRKRGEEALQKSETQLRATLESTVDGILAVDNEGKVLKVNRRFAEIWKLPPSIMNCGDDRTMLDFVMGQLNDPDAFLKKVQSLYDSDAEDLDSLTFKDGRVFERYTAPMIMDDARIGRVWSFREITERKRAEEAVLQNIKEFKNHQAELEKQAEELQRVQLELGESRDKFFALYESAPVGLFILTDKALITDVNLTGAELFEIERSKLINHDLGVFIAPESHDAWNVFFTDIGQHGEKQTCILQLKRTNYSVFPAWLEGVRLTSSNGVITVRIAISNITEQKRVEEALQESEEKYHIIFENAGDAILIHDFEGNLIEVNNIICRRLGYSREELLKMKTGDLDDPVNARKMEGRILELNKNGHLIFETVHITRDGRKIPTEVSSVVFHFGNKQFLMSIARDITERKRAEEALQDSEKKYYNLYHNSALGIFHSTFEGKFIDANPSLANMLGYNSPEDMIISITNIARQIYYESPEYDDLATAVLNDGGFIHIENRYRRRDGTLLHGNLHLRIVPEQRGIPSHYEGFVEDITKRKLSEEALCKSEDKYRTVADFTYDWEFWITPDGNYNYVSPSCERITGYRPEEFILDPDLLIKIMHNDDRDKIAYHLSSKESHNIEHSALEFRIITKNGKERWIGHVCQPIYNTNGEYHGNRGSNRDITERKRAEEALRENEEKLNAMLESIADHMSMIDKDLNIIWANETAKRYFGQDLVGRKCYEAYHQRQNPYEPYPCITLKAFQDGEIHRHETTVINIRGQTEFFECSANVALNDENGKSIAVLEISRDISERKQVEESLRQTNKKLSLVSGISRHDINNKLMIMKGLICLLENEQLDPILNEYLSKLSTTANRISDMIRFTKEYEQIGVQAPVWQECHKLVDNAVKQVLPGQVVVENDLPPGLEVFEDLLIGKVFYNLIDNAVRHGGKITTIRFFMKESDDSHLIICEDDGDGVPAEYKEEIFERGFGKNSGLGLTLAREILGITGITIRENGEPGKGARFEITVPNGKWRYGSEPS